MNNYNTDTQDKFSATLIRKLIDGQPVESYIRNLQGSWKNLAEAIVACPPNADQRIKAFEAGISDLDNEDQIREAVFSADLKTDLESLKAKIGSIPGLISADEILTTEWPEPVWAVPGILPVGLGILGGPPKMGKSWLALQIA